jgi:hypothetical protein
MRCDVSHPSITAGAAYRLITSPPRALDLTLAKPRIVSTLLLEARIVATIETPSQGARA